MMDAATDNNATRVRLSAELVVDPQVLTATLHVDSKRLKELLLPRLKKNKDDDHHESGTGMVVMGVVVAAANETDGSGAASSGDHAQQRAEDEAPINLNPMVLMAARGGNRALLMKLLQLRDVDVKDAHGNGKVGCSCLDAALAWAWLPVPGKRSAAPPPPPPGSAPTTPPPPLDGRVTTDGDTVLHVVAASGDGNEFQHCARMIVLNYKDRNGGTAAAAMRLLEAQKRKEPSDKGGDTPLHCAAGAGNANMISCLIGLIAHNGDANAAAAAAMKKALVNITNQCGETALHQAIGAPKNNEECIDQLMDVDPELACIPRDDGASPLYLAISLGKVKSAQHLYEKSLRGKLSYSGPDGRNVLHAAVPRGQALPMILRWLSREDGAGGCSSRRGTEAGAACDLTKLLMSQRDKKQKGSTPLHLAASLEGWLDARFLSTRFAEVRLSMSATKQLLHASKSTAAYQADDEGSYPIHVAARAGSLDVVKLLLQRCPDCATLRDGQGRTFLHVAAEEERHAVVGYVCGDDMPEHLSSMILNAQDSNGDTALHGAVRAGNLAVFNCLFGNRLVLLGVENKHRMTPLDLSFTMIPARFNYRLNPRNIVSRSLLAAGAPHGGYRPELFSEKHMPKRDLDKEAKMHTEATQVMGVVAALVATVTFASAFTLPGGYRSSDGGGGAAAAGTPVLAGSYAFDAFILADTLAFICSISATCTLVYAGVPAMDLSLRSRYFDVSAVMMQSAARSLACAIALGLYPVLAPVDPTLAVTACVIIFATSLYGNMEPWRIIHMAAMVLARITASRRAWPHIRAWAQIIFFEVFVRFGSYIIIFGLPAIRRWFIPAIHKWWVHAHQKHL